MLAPFISPAVTWSSGNSLLQAFVLKVQNIFRSRWKKIQIHIFIWWNNIKTSPMEISLRLFVEGTSVTLCWSTFLQHQLAQTKRSIMSNAKFAPLCLWCHLLIRQLPSPSAALSCRVKTLLGSKRLPASAGWTRRCYPTPAHCVDICDHKLSLVNIFMLKLQAGKSPCSKIIFTWQRFWAMGQHLE